ncbi:Dabb family protein [Puniceicoccales bacterium CK1056]|uniref:Dabb family protein n=1 Tax=Oceanipulchritudo coccoides TaxID=2706888 RepID=A0A6B2M105_9BACT|nr:Dabb family protein [Oceanipulchritudo coccoides]NDV62588.1 Dabb family protein [Oceanipulchritudo coccoides]
MSAEKMITHLVFFRMLPEAEGSTGEENAAELVEMLMKLPGKIPELVKLEAGRDFSRTPASFDVGLLTQFENKEDLETYRIHPEHQKVVKFVQKTTSERAVVDYESR